MNRKKLFQLRFYWDFKKSVEIRQRRALQPSLLGIFQRNRFFRRKSLVRLFHLTHTIPARASSGPGPTIPRSRGSPGDDLATGGCAGPSRRYRRPSWRLCARSWTETIWRSGRRRFLRNRTVGGVLENLGIAGCNVSDKG